MVKKKKDELTKKVIFSLVLSVVFFSLYFFTLEEELPEYVLEEYGVNDNSNYMRAKVTDNNYFCGLIEHKTLKKICFSEITNSAELLPVPVKSEEDVMDEGNLMRAKVTLNPEFCDMIQNTDLKAECFSVISG